MARILQLIAGIRTAVTAITSSAGAADADKIPATNGSGVLDPTILNAATTGANKIPILDGTGKLDPTTMPTGIGADTASIVTSENLAAGDLVNVYNNAGTPTARKADATAVGKEAVGFVLAGTASPAAATVYFEGRLTGLTGLTPGAVQYLHTTAGARSETPPSTTGNVVQRVGTAITSTSMDFEKTPPITLA